MQRVCITDAHACATSQQEARIAGSRIPRLIVSAFQPVSYEHFEFSDDTIELLHCYLEETAVS